MEENITEIKEFLTNEEVDLIIKRGETSFKTVTTLDKSHSDYRIAKGTWLSNHEEISQKVRNKISNITKISIDNMENLHIVKYETGGEYKIHCDFFEPNSNYYNNEIAKGGQRTLSALIYLNDDFEGGATHFPRWQKTIIPERNKLVIWKNIKDNGELEYDSLHAGLPVTKGIKYIAIIWIRKNKF